MLAALRILIASAIGLIASGGTALTSVNADTSDVTLMKTGIVILLLSWLDIAVVTLFSPARTHIENRVMEDRQ
jgi:hypothetical protein